MSSSSIMDFIGALTAAGSAGKLPSTKQSNDLANWLLKSPILQLEASAAGCGGKLSENGTTIMRDIREIIEAGQAAATEKNGDDILQNALFTLGRAGRQQSESQGGYGQQSKSQHGAQDPVGAFRVATEALLGSLDWSGQNLRQQSQGASYRDQNRDAMQVDDRDSAAARLAQATYRIAERAQNDQEYRRAIDTIFSIYDQYKTRSINRAQRGQQPNGNELQEDLAEILGGGDALNALKNIRTLIERFAGGKSLQDLLTAAAVCAADLREDQEVRRAVDDYEAFIRRSLDEPRFIQSDEYRQRGTELRQQWDRLRERNSEAGRKWNQDVERVERESREFNEAVEKDASVQRLRNAHLKLASHIATIAPTAGKLAPASFMMSDLADAILPRAFSMLKGIPLPRTEYADEETEFVLENLNLESLQLQPGHVKITNQASPDLDAPGPASNDIAHDKEERTRIEFTGVQLKLKPVSFYYKDKTGSGAAPSQVNGQLDVKLPQKGLNVDLQVSVLPTGSGDKQREKSRSFLRVDQASISLDDATISMSKTNHPVSTTLFKPVLRTRLLSALKQSLEQYLRTGVEMAGSLAFDVNDRAQVFADASRVENVLGAHALGLTSVIDRMLREGSVLQGEKSGPMRGEQQQRVRGEGVPAEAESFSDSVARMREAEQRSEGWRSGAYQLPAGAA